MAIEIGSHVPDLILGDQDFAFCQGASGSVGEDLVGDMIDLDLEVLGNDAGVMHGEEEVQVDGWIQGGEYPW